MKRLVVVTLAWWTAGLVWAADMEGLRPSARWLATERLKGTLFHHAVLKPPETLLLAPESETARAAAGVRGPAGVAPLALAGRHHLLLLPASGEPIRLRLKTLRGRLPWESTVYAVFDPAGEELATGLVGKGREEEITVAPRGAGPHVLLLNPGPAANTVTEVSVLNGRAAVDARPVQAYRDGPQRRHFLRELKLGGFNVAMIDVESLPQEFSTAGGLEKWTLLVRDWAEAARRYQIRAIFAVDLGGTPEEVESWGDAPKGLYLEQDAKIPLAPCPLAKVYWERVLLRRGRAVARLARQNPYVVGYGIDPEMYQSWKYGHYMLGGTCFCDHCLGGFLRRQGLPADVLARQTTGRQRHDWLVQKKLWAKYDSYLEGEMAGVVAWCRDELHRIHPDLLWCVYVLDIGNWFCRGLAKGLGRPDLPVINFCETTYYGVGYDRAFLDGVLRRSRDWGANLLQGSAIWDLYFPPTRPAYLAAHAFNLGVRGEGWWYWPGDRLYDDWQVTHAYEGQPATFGDYWTAATAANREIDLAMAYPGRRSWLDRAEPVPWRGKYNEQADGWTADSGVRNCRQPPWRLKLAAPATLCFAVPRRAREVRVTCRTPGPGNGAALSLIDPAGQEAGRRKGALDRPESIAAAAREGVWSLAVSPAAGLDLREVDLALEPGTIVSARRDQVLVSPTKQPGLIAYWPMNEGRGSLVADVSQKVAYPGVLQGGRWTTGVAGAALAFDGRTGGVLVPAGEGLHGLSAMTLSAWVRLDALPQPSGGATLVNKGPEAPGQHAWWWIGYPPDYPLILELGSASHPYGASFGSRGLAWELGRWYHVAATMRSAAGQTIVAHYRDGQLVGTHRMAESFDSGEHELKLGTYGGIHVLCGALDEVKIWDRWLEPGEIAAEGKRR
jgi:hypothetical protein